MILSASNIFKSFEKGKDNKIEVVKDVSLTLNKNEITVIVGASGAGKSTLLRILSGLDKPDSGDVEIDGENNMAPLCGGFAKTADRTFCETTQSRSASLSPNLTRDTPATGR